jgi:tetratricopeptide (TPR) repeat protein
MFEGKRELSLQAMRDLQQEMPVELVLAFPDFLDAFVAVPIHVMVRFGLWEDILKEPVPQEPDLLAARAFWRYGRTVAFSSLGRVDEAAKEFALFQEAQAAVPESRLLGNNPVPEVLRIGACMAEGEMEYRRGNYDRAFALLREGVDRDDALRYDEPWGWMQPVRHALGALLLEQGELEEAEAVYRKDLQIHPGNGWALHGLAETLRKEGKVQEADKTEAAFQEAWANADIRIKASCFCRKS